MTDRYHHGHIEMAKNRVDGEGFQTRMFAR